MGPENEGLLVESDVMTSESTYAPSLARTVEPNSTGVFVMESTTATLIPGIAMLVQSREKSPVMLSQLASAIAATMRLAVLTCLIIADLSVWRGADSSSRRWHRGRRR